MLLSGITSLEAGLLAVKADYILRVIGVALSLAKAEFK
jgi:hypothetical protein